jgi:hypothetical protein
MMKRDIERVIRGNVTTIIASVGIICILGLGGLILYKVVNTEPVSTKIFFNMESDLPETSAALKYGTIGDKEPLNVIEIGKRYEISFTISSKMRTPASYRYVVDSKIKKEEKKFTLNPGDNMTFTLTITPTELDKWSYERTDSVYSSVLYDIPNDSWLGERIDYEIIASENSKAYTYAPISVDIGEFRRALNMNLTLHDLRTNPFRKQYTVSTTKTEERDIEIHSLITSIKNNRLSIDANTTTVVYKTKPEMFTIRLYEDSPMIEGRFNAKPGTANSTVQDSLNQEHSPATLGFWYQIR